MRTNPKNAQFNTAPESSAETADGASLCASGSQVCRGAKTHFRAVTDKKQKARGLQPRRLQRLGVRDEFGQHQRKTFVIRLCRRHAQKEIGQQRQRNADRADEQIFPGRFERAMVPVKINQRRARQRGRLDGHPDQSEMLADRHQRHRRQEQKKTTDENRFRRVVEEKSFLHVGGVPVRLLAEVADDDKTTPPKTNRS